MNTNTKSAQPVDVLAVDVLAVMDDCAGSLSKLGSAGMVRASELREARAAAAELVEDRDALAKALRDILEAGLTGPGHVRLFNAGRAALARIAPNELHDKAAELCGRGE